MKTTKQRRQSRQDYSGLSITALAFGTMLSVAILAFGCGENIGGNSTPTKTDGRATVPTPRSEHVATVTPPSTVVLPASVETSPAPVSTEPVTFEDAETAYMERRYEDASRLFAGYVAGHQENAWGFYMLGLSSWKSGNREAAEKAFGQALELDRGHVKSWVNLGRVLLELERPDEALQNIDEALALKPESNDALRTRGRALDELGRTDDAVAAYTDALLVDEEDAWSMNNMGLAYIRSERFDKALPPLARAVELRDDVAVFYNNLGIALERSGYTAQAAAAYTSAVSIDSTYAKASANLARVEGIETDSAALSVDLDRLAVEFADEIVRRMANGNTDSTFETPDKDAGEAESEDAAEDAEAAKEAQVPVELEDEVDAIDLIKGEANGAQAYQRPTFAPADSKR